MNDIPTLTHSRCSTRLIKLAVDPGACERGLIGCSSAIDKAAEAEQRLAERSAAFDQKVVTEKAALDERKAALDARALQLSHREAAAEQIIERRKIK